MSSCWVYSNAWSEVRGYFTLSIMTLRSIALSLLLLSIMALGTKALSIMSKPNDIQHKIPRLAILSIITYYKTQHNDSKRNDS